jgi:DNA-binding MarR family transcriptional regulator
MSKDITTAGAAERVRDPIAEARRQWEQHGWGDAAPGMAAATTIVRVSQIITSLVETALAPLGLSFARFEILRLLGFSRAGKLPMGKIGERLQVHPASVTSAVKRLERDGLVWREVDGADNRVVLAALTDRGRRLLDPATDAVNEVFRALGPGDAELDDLVRSLDRIRVQGGDIVVAR